MNNTTHQVPQFGTKEFLRASIPSYFCPLFFSGLPALLLEKKDLLHASYSTIALPSLLATVIVFFVLSQCQKQQVLILNRWKMTLLLSSMMICISFLIIEIFGWYTDILNIIPSAFIGTAIVSMSTPLKKNN